MKPRLSFSLASAVATLVTISYAHAASTTWNLNADGAWTTGVNWLSGSAPGATTGTTSADVATFGTIIGAARAITVDANRNIAGINFAGNSFAYTLSGGNLLLTNAGTIQTSGAGSAHTDTISTGIEIQGDGGSAFFTAGSSTATRLLSIGGGVTGVSTGSNVTTLTLNGSNTGGNLVGGLIGDGAGGGKLALVKSGSGTWTLSNTSNSYSGGTFLNGGVLSINSDGQLGNSSGGITFNNGTLQTSGGVSSARPITLTGAGTIQMNVAATPTFSGKVTGAGALFLNQIGGAGTHTFTFSNTGNDFTGDLVTGGNSGSSGQNYGVVFNSLGDGVGSKISLTSGTGTTVGFAYGSGATAPLILNNRRLELNNVAGSAVNVYLSNQNVTHGVTFIQDLTVTATAARTLTLDAAAGPVNTFAGKLINGTNGVSITKTGGGLWALTNAANSYANGTTVSAGTLAFVSGALGSAGTINASGGTLLWLSGNTQDISSRLAMTALGTSRFDTNGNNVTFASAIGSSSTALLTKTGLGTLTLQGNNTYTGITSVNGGSLLLDKTGTGALASTSPLTLGGGIFSVKGATSGATTQTLGALTLNVGSTNRIVLDSNGGASNTLTLASSAPTRANASTLLVDLSIANTVLTSTLGLAAAAQTTTQAVLGYAAVKDASGTGFAANVGGNIVRYTGADVLLNTSTSATTNYKTNPTGSSTTGSPYLTTAASPLLNSLSIDTSGATGANFLNLNGTVTLTQRAILMTGNNDFTIQGGTSLGASGNETIIHNYGTGTLTINSSFLTAAAPVSKDGPGTVVLGSASSSFTNTLRINEGILRLGSAGGATNGPLGTIAAGTVVHSGGALDLGGFTLGTAEALTINGTGVSSGGALTNSGGAASYSGLLTLGSDSSIVASSGNISLSNTGTITGSGFGLTVGGAANTSIAGIIGTGPGSLTKTGAGTLTLSNSNTYTGATTVSAGTLRVQSGSINSSGALTVAAGAKLVYNSSTALTVAPTLNGNTVSNRAVLGGTGTINSAVTLNNLGDTLSPGNSPGVQNFTPAQTWASFSYDWEVNDFTGMTAGTSFDQIGVGGTLNLTGGSGSYILNVLGLTAGDVSGLVPNFSEIDRTWTILTSTGITGFSAANWTINTTGFTDPYAGSWALGQTGNNLVLSYTAVPEMNVAALVGGFGVLVLLRRRRH